MINTLNQLTAILNSLHCENLDIELFEAPDSKQKAFAILVNTDEQAFKLWQKLRSVVHKTQMWPVLYTSFCAPPIYSEAATKNGWWKEALHNEGYFAGRIYDEAFVKKVGEHAEQTNAFATVLEAHNQMCSENLEEDFVYSLETTQARFGIAPDPLLIKALITSGEINSYFGLEKWLLAWEIENVPNEEILEPAYTGYLDWFTPSAMNQLQVLCLLPTTNCWEVLSFWEFYGGTEIPMAMLKYWNKKYGAELVAHFGTMLQFVVAKPPQNLEQAFQLACEQESIAFCTTLLPGIPLREHARALMKAKTWFLHERP